MSLKEKEKEKKPMVMHSGIDFSKPLDAPIVDPRWERESKRYSNESKPLGGGASSTTFDALIRMAAGNAPTTLAQKMQDPNRPTLDQYKKDNADKLDNVGGEVKKMVEYRAMLDKEREERLQSRIDINATSKRKITVDSDDDDGGDNDDDVSSGSGTSSNSSESDSDETSSKDKRKHKKRKKDDKKEKREKKSKKKHRKDKKKKEKKSKKE